MVTINKTKHEIAGEVFAYIANTENEMARRFMDEHDKHFALYVDPETIKALKFISDKCFRIGFKQGTIAMLDAVEMQRKKETVSEEDLKGWPNK